MSISDLELAELKSRTAKALRTNSTLANVGGHIQAIKERIGSDVRKQGSRESGTEYLYSLITLAETMPAASESDATRVKHRDKFIKDAVSKGKFVMSVARTTEELAEQLNEDLKVESTLPTLEEGTTEAVKTETHPEAKEHSEKHSKGKKDKKKS